MIMTFLSQARSSPRVLAELCVVTAVLGLSNIGCQTSPYRHGNAAAETLSDAAAAVQHEQRAIDSAVEALGAVLVPSASDTDAQFREYVARLDALERAARRTRNTGQLLHKKAAAHLAAWDQQIRRMSYEAVRVQSLNRRESVAGALHALQERYAGTEQAVAPLITYLRDLEKALDADLTPEGLEAVTPIGQNARANAERLQVGLATLSKELEVLSARLASGSPGPDADIQPDPEARVGLR